ncbi:MAG TPA: GGDEF domain-containing protein [Acidimicrobiales bacterium]|nr:GGDEF domain-containing protein [Acidimicrobiales bacterium]
MTEHRGGADPDARSRALLADLVNELASAPSGVAFIARCLDRVLETWNLAEARAVIDDPVLGIQLFNAGRRPLPPDDLPSRILALGPGIHTEPPLCDEVEGADIDAITQLCELALKLDRLRYESLHDSLTGLYNRRGFDEHLAAAISRSVRYGWSFGLAIIDLDGFKSINDRVGHQGGDAALRRVGEQLRQSLRSGDIAARVGGDEFALLVPVEGPSSLEAILDRLHGTGGFAEVGEVAWTAGLAMCPDEAATVDELYRVADQRLYEAKANGIVHASAQAPSGKG